jgi:hypothetical protein
MHRRNNSIGGLKKEIKSNRLLYPEECRENSAALRNTSPSTSSHFLSQMFHLPSLSSSLHCFSFIIVGFLVSSASFGTGIYLGSVYLVRFNFLSLPSSASSLWVSGSRLEISNALLLSKSFNLPYACLALLDSFRFSLQRVKRSLLYLDKMVCKMCKLHFPFFRIPPFY